MKRGGAAWLLLALAGCLSACSTQGPSRPDAVIQATNASGAASLAAVDSWTYWLSNPDVGQLAASDHDLVVMDYSADGTDARRFGRDAVAHLQDQGKIVLAYLSVGEAEEYRFYWSASWASAPPDFLGPPNPEWPGAHKVRYWDPAWRRDVLAPYLDRITAAGFDGAYLDIVDGYWFWSQHGQDLQWAADRMAELAAWVANYARRRSPGRFLVCIQNGLGIFDHASPVWSQRLMRAIDMAAVESLFFNYYSEQDQAYRLKMLERLAKAGKTLLDVEYIPAAKREEYMEKIKSLPFRLIPYRAAPDRALDELADDGKP